MKSLRLTEAEYAAIKARLGGAERGNRRGHPVLTGPNKGKKWEDLFAWQLDREMIPYEREYRFLADRKFRFDFALVPVKIAVEIDGGVHRIKQRWTTDREKGNLALLTGWRVLHVDAVQVRSGGALMLLKRLL